MKITWYWPDKSPAAAVRLLEGNFRIDRPLASPGEDATYATVRDQLRGYNVVRVDFDDETNEEKQQIMETLLEAARIQYNERYCQ